MASGHAELQELKCGGRAGVFPVDFSRKITLQRDMLALLHLLRLFRTQRFHVVHTHTPKAGLLGMLAGWLTGVPVRIHTLHGLPLETARGWKRKLLTVTERLTCRLAGRVCVVSSSLKNRVLELRLCPPGKMTILGEGSACGVDLNKFRRTPAVEARARAIRQELGIPETAVVVGFVGWMVADKGVMELVKVFQGLAEDRRDLYLLMAGADGGNRDPLPAATWEAIRGNPRIHYVGRVPDPEHYYTAMDLLVLPSRREGFGLAIAEAGAMGVPAVATRVTGCVDAVMDGRTGVLVSCGDIAGLQDAIHELVLHAGFRRELGRAAADRVRARFASERLIAAHLDLYRAMLTRG
jgi:glycosyltransferase involved in cell wall biosynthesis